MLCGAAFTTLTTLALVHGPLPSVTTPRASVPLVRRLPLTGPALQLDPAESALGGNSISEEAAKLGRVALPEDPPSPPTAIQDALAGLTVAFSLLSKAIACSALVGVNPLVGVWSSVVMGLSAPLLRSRPGVISGAAAVVAVPLSAFVAMHGTSYIPLVILLSAAMQFVFAIARWSPLASLISPSVMAGFLNGLGLVLFKSQVQVFTKAPALYPALAMASLCFVVVQALPLITTAIPASLAGIAVASIAGVMLKLPLDTLASTAKAGTFAGGASALPSFLDPSSVVALVTSPAAIKLCLPAAFSIALISLLETLLAGRVVDELGGEEQCSRCTTGISDDEYEECCGVSSQSVMAMAVGNTASALLGGFGGCGLIPQTVLNIKSGGGGPVSSLVYAVALAAFVLLLAPLVGQISHAALAGIMFCVAYDTVQWGATATALKSVASSVRAAASEAVANRGKSIVELTSLTFATAVCYRWDMVSGILGGALVEGVGKWVLRRVAAAEASRAPA